MDIIQTTIQEFKRAVFQLYQKKLKHVILYGSWARGQGNSESDIDLAVVLAGKITPGKEIDRMLDIITNLNLEYDVLISVYPVSEKNYTSLNSPLLINVRQEGVVV